MSHHPQPLEITDRSPDSDIGRVRARKLLEAAGADAVRVAAGPSAALVPSLEWAGSGAMALSGARDGPPRLANGPLASAARGAGLAIAALSGRAEHASRDWPALLGERAARFGLERRGATSCGGHARLLEARDGWIAVHLPREDDWRSVPAWLEDEWPDAIDRAALHEAGAAATRAWGWIADRVRDHAAAELVARARLMGLAAAEAPRAIAGDRADGWHLDHTTETPPRRRGLDRGARLRVLDLSSLWSGPLATSVLVECGADVLKVESPTRPDGARAGEAGFFALMNAGKSPAALDLREVGDRARFEALLDLADVVVESARPRALAQLGYDAAGWASGRAGRLWVSITGYGREHEWIAFGDDAAVAAGLAWSDDAATPAFCGDAIADPLTGLHAAALILAHQRAGRGGLLSLSLRDIVADCARASDPTAALARVERSEEDDAWTVCCGDARVAVAAPRARAAIGAAPGLQPPERGVFDRWKRPAG